MKIEIDDKSGFCFGVVKAITKAEESLASGGESLFARRYRAQPGRGATPRIPGA